MKLQRHGVLGEEHSWILLP